LKAAARFAKWQYPAPIFVRDKQMALVLPAELRDLLTLTLVPGLGPRLTTALLEHFGSASAARQAATEELREIPHIGARLAGNFAAALRSVDVDAEIERLERFGVSLLALGSPDYPSALATIPDPPHLLYRRGELRPADAKAVAMVGSRQCTPYGKRTTERLAAGLARAGYCVVSGLARGIDAAAHQGALSANGRTVAVLAGGLSAIYPPEHDELARSIEASGALLTETPMAMQPQRGMFHARNRLISGLANAVVVIEANDRSGALITARHAAEQGRDVFALPANADSPTSAGSLRLLRNGARLIRDIDDLLEDLDGIPVQPPAGSEAASEESVPAPVAARPNDLGPVEGRIWDLLDEAKPIDEMIRTLGMPVGELARLLMSMELKKQVRRMPGNIYQRRT
jgi:DNA processing protein